MSVLTKEELFAEGALKTETVTLKSGDVIVSEIGGSDYIKLWSYPKNQRDTGTMVIRNGVEESTTEVDMSRFTPALISYSVLDEAGNRMFTEADIDKLSKLNSTVFLKLSEVARRLNGLGGEEVKNSDGSQSDLPFLDSASISESDTLTN